MRLFSSGHPPQAHNSTSLYHSHATGCHNHQHYATSMGLIYKSGHGTSSAPRGKHEAVCYRQAYFSLLHLMGRRDRYSEQKSSFSRLWFVYKTANKTRKKVFGMVMYFFFFPFCWMVWILGADLVRVFCLFTPYSYFCKVLCKKFEKQKKKGLNSCTLPHANGAMMPFVHHNQLVTYRF